MAESDHDSGRLPGQAEMTGNSGASQSRAQDEARNRDMQDIVGILSHMVDKITSASGSKAGVEASSGGDQYLKSFQSFSPPIFKGARDLAEAEDWLDKIERILEGIDCPDEKKVLLVTFALEGEAMRWWRAQHRERFDSAPLAQICWEDFVEVFREWFVPPSTRLALQDQFINLTQGTKTVLQYEAEFTALSRYAPQYIGTPEEKCHRFLKGLQGQLRLLLTSLGIQKFSELVTRACALERELNESGTSFSSVTQQPQYSGYQQSGKRRYFDRADDRKGKQIKVEQKPRFVPYEERPVCGKCNKRHFGQCWWESTKCFKCGQVGHRRADCPLERKFGRGSGAPRWSQGSSSYAPQQYQRRFGEESSVGRSKFSGKPAVSQRGETVGSQKEPVRARVFTISSQEAKESEDVVTGMIFIENQLGSVLFDSGASHSFISEEFSVSLAIELSILKCPLSVTLPSGDVIVAKVCSARICVHDRQLLAELIILPIKMFDVILGMDWLVKHYATIECWKKRVAREDE